MSAASVLDSVTVRGVRMAFEEAGAGRPLVCVHGNYASKRWFSEQLARPPASWRVVAPDLPNFGDSDPLPADASIEAYASFLRRFLDALGLERVTLLGHSLGGAVAQVFAAGLPGRIDGLILVASAPPGSLYGLSQANLSPGGFRLPKLDLAGVRRLELPDFQLPDQSRAQVTASLRSVMPTRQPPYFEALVDDALRMNAAARQGNLNALLRYNTAQLSEFPGPVLVLRGGRDTIISEAMARRTQGVFSRSRLELWPEVGHSPQLEAPEKFNILLSTFLKEVGQAGR